jgi:diguanylate cyclase (GGDEF)-like protein
LRFGHETTMLVIDIDDFKEINDTLGHPQGDEVLKAIAETVRETTRSIDVGARYGGDELALLLLETGPEGALILAERLRERVAARPVPRTAGGTMNVTVSVGVATLPYAASDRDELIEAADQALLRAKRSGKNQTRVAPHIHTTPEQRPAEHEERRPARRG